MPTHGCHQPHESKPDVTVVSVDARSAGERLDSALSRLERVCREFDDRLAWN